jgi:hypothetical protein
VSRTNPSGKGSTISDSVGTRGALVDRDEAF